MEQREIGGAERTKSLEGLTEGSRVCGSPEKGRPSGRSCIAGSHFSGTNYLLVTNDLRKI